MPPTVAHQPMEVPPVNVHTPPVGRFDKLLQSVDDLLQSKTLNTEIAIKRHPTSHDMRALLRLQSEVQKVHLGVEVISRINESVLSITKKVQNG